MKEICAGDNVIPLFARPEFSDKGQEDTHEMARAALKVSLQREGDDEIIDL